MFRTIIVAALFTLFFPLASLRADEPTYDLRGPGRKVGERINERMSFEMKDAAIEVSLAGQVVSEAKLSLECRYRGRIDIQGVEAGRLTKFTSEVLDETTTSTTQQDEMEPEKEVEQGCMVGKQVVSTKLDDSWIHRLAEGTPTEEQKQELNGWSWLDDDEDVVHSEQIKIGKTFDLGPAILKRMIGITVGEKERLKQTFTRIEEVDGDPCAVIEWSGKVRGKMNFGDGDIDTEVTPKFAEYRSLKKGLPVKITGTMELTMSTSSTIDQRKLDMTIRGQATVEWTNELIAPGK